MGEIKNEPAEQYHANYDFWSRSMLSTFRESKREAYLRYVDKSAPKEGTKSCMKLGSLAHCMLMQPSEVYKQFQVIPNEFLATNGAISTKAAKQFVEECSVDGITAIKQSEYDNSKRVVDSVRVVCGKWLEKATHIEKSIYWVDKVSGLKLKCRPDWFVETPECNLIFDLKTTTRIIPHTFTRVIEQHDYWLQECHYRQGVHAATGKPCQMFFVGVEQDWPYRSGLFQFTDDTRNKAFETWLSVTKSLADTFSSGDWSDPWEKEITQITLKDFCFRS